VSQENLRIYSAEPVVEIYSVFRGLRRVMFSHFSIPLEDGDRSKFRNVNFRQRK